ncbi:hypothetical protein BTS2_0538 [Bacillus sp. TS-2]|nr:hypothetical protein BTS2_0538 [Bacillus sp. TS-2]
MNERSKQMMNKQQQVIYDTLKSFNFPVYEDELTEEDINPMNFFLIVYGDFKKSEAVNHLTQEIYVVYVSEDNPEVETKTLDLITVIDRISGIDFHETIKRRLQKKKADKFVDQVTLVFSRKVKYDQVRD